MTRIEAPLAIGRRYLIVADESSFSPGGGIAATTERKRASMSRILGREATLITPLHHRTAKTNAILKELEVVAPITGVRFRGEEMPLQLLRHRKSNTYFVDARDAGPQWFGGSPTPYDTSNLLYDALLFGVAVRQALRLIDPGALTQQWVLELQDWEAATTALAMPKGLLILTLHNSYDRAVSDELLRAFEIDPVGCPGPWGASEATILERAIPLCLSPIRTVSRQFGRDLLSETFQVHVMADHLQKVLGVHGLVGVDNGPFCEVAQGLNLLLAPPNAEALASWKREQRQAALRALDEYQPAANEEFWGDKAKFNRSSAPWFVMAGREDRRQKGYDVAARACRSFLLRGGNARFLFFPIPAGGNPDGLRFLQELSKEFPADILVFPSFFPGFQSFMKGADYGLMPSLFEPFGMASEFALNGVPVVARATGGILEQVVPLRACAAFGDAVESRVDFPVIAPPTGLLYREPDDVSFRVEDWVALNDIERDPSRWAESPLFGAMASELCLAVEEASRIVRDQPSLYYRMLVSAVEHVQNRFSWEQNASTYARQVHESIGRSAAETYLESEAAAYR